MKAHCRSHAVALTAALMLCACGSGLAPSQDTTAAARTVTVSATDLSFLQTDGSRLVDAQGREVLLRGFNHIALRSDRNHPPYRDAQGQVAAPSALFELQDVQDEDFALIASMGVNALRLVVTWEFAQPDPPPAPYNETYFRLIDDFIAKARAHGLYVVFDFGQFGWSRSLGGNAGAPDWTVEDTCLQLPKVPSGAPPQASPAVACAYYNFWINDAIAGTHLQDLYLDLWRAVARRYRDEPAVAMYDLYNEPFGGPLPPGLFELSYLYPFYQRLSAAIREIDARHIVAFQPEIFHSLGIPTPFATPLGISNAVYIPHEYTVAYFTQRATPAYLPVQSAITQAYLQVAAQEAGTFGTPWMIGETGWTRSSSADGVGSPVPMSDTNAPRQFAQDFLPMADTLKLGWLWFAYSSIDEAYGINFQNQPDVPLIATLSRPFPRAVAGRVSSFSFDASSGAYTQTTSAMFDAPSEIALPLSAQYPQGACVYGDTGLIGAVSAVGATTSAVLNFDAARQVLRVQPLPASLRVTRANGTCAEVLR